jgi:glycosyltransferase involved in cell wall biosynthesis
VDAAGGVSLERFHPPVPDPRASRPQEEAVRVLVYGRVSRARKGTWLAARAVERAAEGVPVTLTFFDSPPSGESPVLPGPLRIPHQWVLNPTQEALASLYREADLFVSAERRAGWCNTAAEAMASGAAVVCTRSGTEDFAVDGVTASVVRWRWTRALAAAIRPLLRDPARRAALAARGRERIQAFSWERTADRIEGALTERLGGARAREASQAAR